MKHSIITLHNISKSYQQGGASILVLNGINTVFEQGISYAITGASGTGKSTLLHIIAALDKPSSGTIIYNNYNHNNFDYIHTHILGLMFQSPHLISELSVEENVMLTGLIAGKAYDECLPRSRELLDLLDLSDKKSYYPAQLSGGQQQRVALARALFNRPHFIIADEPTSSLDPRTGKDIVDLLIACKKEWGMGIIVSSHDAYISDNMDIIYELKDGKLHQIK